MTTEAEQRQAVVAAVRKWVLTPYHFEADILGAGVDCGMLLVRVFVDLGLVPPFDPRPYPPDWMLHRDEERYLGWVYKACGPVEKPQPGDIALFRFGRCYSHGALIINKDEVCHAFYKTNCVTVMRRDETDLVLRGKSQRPVKYFRVA